jgi:hypothetical protein
VRRGTEALVLVRGIGVAIVPLALLAGLCAAPDIARAQGALILPVEADSGLAAHGVSAHEAVERALEAQGVELQSYASARERAGGELAECREVTCGAELCKKARAQLVVLVAVHEVENDDGRLREVQVTLVEPSDARYFGRAPIVRGDSSRAGREALLDARAYQLLGPGPHLRIESEPKGADVVIDDELSGETPYRALIRPGRHTVEVKLQGYKTDTQVIEVVRGAQEPTRLRVTLKERSHATGTGKEEIEADIDNATMAAPKDDSRPIVGPLILGVIGLGLITYDVVMIAKAGCERHEPTPGKTCTETSEVDPAPAIVIGGVGAAALGAGIVWFLLGGDDDDERGVSARIGPRIYPLGAELRAKF